MPLPVEVLDSFKPMKYVSYDPTGVPRTAAAWASLLVAEDSAVDVIQSKIDAVAAKNKAVAAHNKSVFDNWKELLRYAGVPTTTINGKLSAAGLKLFSAVGVHGGAAGPPRIADYFHDISIAVHGEAQNVPFFAWNSAMVEPFDLSKLLKVLKAWEQQRRIQMDAEAALKKAESLKPARAVEFLTLHGKKIGVDYEAHNAVSEADEFKFLELISENVKRVQDSGELLDFNGKNCDDCDGWDGESRRCSCGNRRVSWDSSGDFESMYIFGDAY